MSIFLLLLLSSRIWASFSYVQNRLAAADDGIANLQSTESEWKKEEGFLPLLRLTELLQ